MSSNGSNPVPLADLVEDKIGGVWGDPPDSAEPDNIAVLVLRGADFRDWSSRRAANAARRAIPRRALARRELRLGDLVLEVSGGGPSQPVGRVVVIDDETLDSAAHPLIPSNFCRRIRLKPGANPYFVKRQLDSLYRNGHFDQYQTSTTNIRNLQVDAFLDGTVLELPAPEEQERLTKFADDFDSRTTSVQSHLSLALNCMQRFRQSVLAAACSPRAIASSDEWETVPLGTLLKTLDQGWSPQCLNRPKGDAAEWAVIKTTAIQALEFKAAENKALPTTLKSRPTLSIEPGDLLITRAGPRARVGISCLVRKCPPHLMLCDKAYRMRVAPSKVLDEYLELVLNTPQVLDVIESMKTGTSDSGMNLTQKGLLSMAVSLPRIEEQRRIVELTRNLLRQSGSIASAIRAANLALDQVVSSTLDKTFHGSRQTG